MRGLQWGKDKPRAVWGGRQCLLVPGEMPGQWWCDGEQRPCVPTLNTRMRSMPGMEAILISHRQPMVGFTTDARPMINKEPANQNTFPRERKGLKHKHMGRFVYFLPFWSGLTDRWGSVLGSTAVQTESFYGSLRS